MSLRNTFAFELNVNSTCRVFTPAKPAQGPATMDATDNTHGATQNLVVFYGREDGVSYIDVCANDLPDLPEDTSWLMVPGTWTDGDCDASSTRETAWAFARRSP